MESPVAVLADGDNICGKFAKQILTQAQTVGQPTVVRAYLDAERVPHWNTATTYRLIHAGSGKNAADILLAIDAVELALAKGIRKFVIASSDGDFSHVAFRLREFGAKVIGMGEQKAPKSFRDACTTFVELRNKPAIAAVTVAAHNAQPQQTPKATDLDVKIRGVIAAHSTLGEGVAITVVNGLVSKQFGTKIGQMKDGNWRSYFSKRPHLYDLDPKGPQAKVRFKPQGFAPTAA